MDKLAEDEKVLIMVVSNTDSQYQDYIKTQDTSNVIFKRVNNVYSLFGLSEARFILLPGYYHRTDWDLLSEIITSRGFEVRTVNP